MRYPTRRRVLGTLALLGLGGSATQRDLFRIGTPLSGRAWQGMATSGPGHVPDAPGEASVSYDGYGVPHVTAESEEALYFAVGYAQARDRLFQMDLFRRNMRGELSAVFGERTVESDRFHRKMDFVGAAKASWDVLVETSVDTPTRAFAAGVNRYLEDARYLPLEFRLLDYEPEPWSPVDTMLIAKLISWGLTGSFWDLERGVIERAFEAETGDLYPPAYEHDYPIIRPDIHAWKTDGGQDHDQKPAGRTGRKAIPQEVIDWLRDAGGGPNDVIGSNNWVVSGEYTASGSPLLANDPHLTLQVPPVWYEMHLREGDMDVRGVSLPGTPLVVIGQNEHVAWGITNVGADVLDCYTYETRSNGSEYRYEGEWRDVERRTESIEVSDGKDEEVAVEKTVHGPLIEREGSRVGVSWVGLSGTREPLAVYRYNRASGMDDFMDGLRVFDIPGQNLVYMDREGNTMYYPAAKYPIRRIDGEQVRGNRVFDGSAGEGEWQGFTPYGESTWTGFVDFEDIPHLIDPDYVASANQRVVYDYEHYLGDAEYMGDPYRATRIYERLDEAIGTEDIDAGFMKDLQRDVHSTHADISVPWILDTRDAMDGKAREYADELEGWDREMRADSTAALVYFVWRQEFRDAVLEDEFSAAGLDAGYYPGEDWPIQQLAPDSEWFDDKKTDERETREDAITRAMRAAADRIEKEGWKTYGDAHRLSIDHQFPLDFLDYPDYPADGSENTVFNVGDGGATGSSWRMIAQFEGPSYCVIPGGNSGRYGSPHYDDQLKLWLRGDYKEMSFEIPEDTDITFGGDADTTGEGSS